MVYSAVVVPNTTSVSLQSLLTSFGYVFDNTKPVPRVSELKLQFLTDIVYVLDRSGIAQATAASTNGGFAVSTTDRLFELRQANANQISLGEIFLVGSTATASVRVFAYQV